MRQAIHIFKKDARQTIALTDGSASNLRTSAWTREAQSNASTPQTSGTEVALQFRTTGVANGTTIACDAAEITIETPSHAVWRSGLIDWSSITQAPDGCRVPVLLPFAGSADQKLRVRASVYFTVFGDEHATAVQPGWPPTNVPGVGACAVLSSDGPFTTAMVWFRSAFRLPSVLVRSSSGGRDSVTWNVLSYSPFPAELGLSPVRDDFWAMGMKSGGRVTISTARPLAHVRSDIDVREMRVGDFYEVGGKG